MSDTKEYASLSAPWRLEYLKGLSQQANEPCFLCRAADAQTDAERRERLVLWVTDHSVVLLNRYPYANGHLLVAPRAHKADLEELSGDERRDLAEQSTRAVRLLKRAISAQGFNLGINLGRCAGAGLPGHLHQHVVPRWGGDVNFMGIVGQVRIIPEAMPTLHAELLQVATEMGPV